MKESVKGVMLKLFCCNNMERENLILQNRCK